MKKILIGALGAALLVGAAAATPKLPARDAFLFWKPAEQALGYKSIEKIFPVRVARRGPTVQVLPHDTKSFDVSYSQDGRTFDTASFMKANKSSGLIVIQSGKILLERYGLGRSEKDRWTSFSVGKSVTSTLIGAAIKDGHINSLASPVTDYLPELKHTAYDGVAVGDLITMRSGVKWNEDYSDPKSDVAQFGVQPRRADGTDPIEAYMARLPRAHKPGTVFHYDTGETDLAGILVARATKTHLADYLSQKIWSKIGVEQDAVWMLDNGGEEMGGCCISMTLRDYARFGLFFMHGGAVNGEQILPKNWVKEASTSHTKVDPKRPDEGYGYFWWIHPHGTYSAEGIFGQQIFLDPKDDLVIVFNSAWEKADEDKNWIAQWNYANAVMAALHKGK
ncbi:MAG TPA: serine hydrolase [Rhizomicrobium sp.]|jgi:CubicO group peptidase (beta-lactamase class C family)